MTGRASELHARHKVRSLTELVGRYKNRSSQEERGKRSNETHRTTALLGRALQKKRLLEVQGPTLPKLAPKSKQAITDAEEASRRSQGGMQRKHGASKVSKLPSLAGDKRRQNGMKRQCTGSSQDENHDCSVQKEVGSSMGRVKSLLTDGINKPAYLMLYQPFKLTSPYTFSYFSRRQNC